MKKLELKMSVGADRTGPNKSLIPLAKGQRKGQFNKLENFQTATSLLQPNTTEKNCDRISAMPAMAEWRTMSQEAVMKGPTLPLKWYQRSSSRELGLPSPWTSNKAHSLPLGQWRPGGQHGLLPPTQQKQTVELPC